MREPRFGPHKAGDYQADVYLDAQDATGRIVTARIAECLHCGAWFNPTSSGTRCPGNLLPSLSEEKDS
jgi:hypothetical protein